MCMTLEMTYFRAELVQLIVNWSNSELEVQRHGTKKNTLTVDPIMLQDELWMRWSRFFENRTAETEFSVFEFWGRFGSVFRKPTSKIFIGFRTPLSVSSQSNTENTKWKWLISHHSAKHGCHNDFKSLLLTVILMTQPDIYSVTLTVCASVQHALSPNCQLHVTLQPTTTLCVKFTALCSHAAVAWSAGIHHPLSVLRVLFCHLRQQRHHRLNFTHTRVYNATLHTQLWSPSSVNMQQKNCCY